MFDFKFEVRTKKCPGKKQNLSTDKQLGLLQLFNCPKCTNTCRQPWPPLINGLVDDALLELSRERN